MRVIAVETGYSCPLVACVYQRDGLFLYDTQGQLSQQKEYFTDFASLENLVTVDRFRWSDFVITLGDKLESGNYGELLVNGQVVEPLTPLPIGSRAISRSSLWLYVETLKTLYEDKPLVIKEIEESYESGELLEEINRLAGSIPLGVLKEFDERLVVMTRLQGYQYIVKRVREILAGDDWFRAEDANYLFSRLFRLELKNWVRMGPRKEERV